jgi:septum formation protein
MARPINKIVLASASPRRLELLRSLALDVIVMPSTYEEPEHPHLTPRELAIVHARHKCEDVVRQLASAGSAVLRSAPMHPASADTSAILGASQAQDDIVVADEIVVAADTVVDVDNVAYNKPRDAEDAKGMLRDLSGRTHLVHTAFAIAVPDRPDLVEHCESTFVTFYPLEAEEIDEYVLSGEPMDKAGAYGIQGFGATLVERVEGDFYTVMGFPLGGFARTMRRLGFLMPITKITSTSRKTTG